MKYLMCGSAFRQPLCICPDINQNQDETLLRSRYLGRPGGGRIVSISAVRMISMVFIILCHFLQYYENELCQWFNVGVQLFFLISGYLYGKKEISDPLSFLSKGFAKVLTPYFVFLFVAIFLYICFFPNYLSLHSICKSLFCAGTLKGLGHLWFVGYILFCYLLTPYLFLIRKKTEVMPFGRMLWVYIFLILIIQVLGFVFNSYFKPYRIACYVVGFFMPSVIIRLRFKRNMVVSLTVVCGMLLNILRIYLKYITTTPIPSYIVIPVVCYAHLMLGVSLFIVLMIFTKRIKYNSLLVWSDRYSYSVYIVHLLFILSPFSLMDFTEFPMINWAIVLMAILVSAIILQFVSQKLLSIIQFRVKSMPVS